MHKDLRRMDTYSKEKNLVAQHLNDDVNDFALKSAKYTDLDFQWVLRQIKGRQIIRNKVPSWYQNGQLEYPVSLSLEQCSSELTADYKRQLLQTIFRNQEKESLYGADLTGGFGIDCCFISDLFGHFSYVEMNPELCRTAGHNFSVLGKNIDVFCKDAETFLAETDTCFDLLFLDPARRDIHGHKVYALDECQPNVVSLLPILRQKCRECLIKLSPMLDIQSALKQLPDTREIHIVAVDNECKELLFLLDFSERPEPSGPLIHTINRRKHAADQSFSFHPKEEERETSDFSSELDTYLYEPNAAVLKSGAFVSVGKRFGLKKLHPNSHLYTSPFLTEDFPGRILTIDASLKPASKETKQKLKQQAQVNLCTRNYPETVEEIRKKYHLKDGGNQFLYATTLFDSSHILILCRQI